MAAKGRKMELKKNELESPGVSKLLASSNEELKLDNSSLKRSLKQLQNVHEELREKCYEVEMENALFRLRLEYNFFFAALKFLSTVGIGFATNYYFVGKVAESVLIGVVCGLIYLTILFITRVKKK